MFALIRDSKPIIEVHIYYLFEMKKLPYWKPLNSLRRHIVNLMELLIIFFNIALPLLLLFAFRKVVLWYFRIDEHLKNQQEIIALLGTIVRQNNSQSVGSPPTLQSSPPEAG